MIADVSRETTERLGCYAALIRRWNSTVNLVSRGDLDDLEGRHIADCLQMLPMMGNAGVAADLGSGAGLPGMVLAIASGRLFHLIESDQRKAAFLREAARLCQANVVVHARRVEQCGLVGMELITARALAPLPHLLALAAPMLAPSGVCLFAKGKSVQAELTLAEGEWHMAVQRVPSSTDPHGCILRISELYRHDTGGPDRRPT